MEPQQQIKPLSLEGGFLMPKNNYNEYELKTTLGTAVKIENKYKMSLTEVFGKLESAEIHELVCILSTAGGKENDVEFKNVILDNWDYTDLQMAVQELLIKLMFSGTEEQIENKLSKFPVDEHQKNVFREMLELPKVSLTANNSSEQLTE